MNIINKLNPTYLFRMPITITLSPLQQVIGAVALMILASYAIYYFFFRSSETAEMKLLKDINQKLENNAQEFLLIKNGLRFLDGKVDKLKPSDEAPAHQEHPFVPPANPYGVNAYAYGANPHGAAPQGNLYPELLKRA